MTIHIDEVEAFSLYMCEVLVCPCTFHMSQYFEYWTWRLILGIQARGNFAEIFCTMIVWCMALSICGSGAG